MNKLFFILAMASVMLLHPCLGFTQGRSSIPTQAKITRHNIRILAIGCGINENGLNDLNSAQDLVAYKRDSIAAKYIWPSYNNKDYYLNVELNGKVKVEEFKETLYSFARDTKKDDVVIIHILGHGETDSDGNYYYVCSNGKIEGSYICNLLKKMANNGTLVVIFLDTCEAGALFNNNNKNFNNNNGGAIAFYASSISKQKAQEIEQNTRFTKTILSTIRNENLVAFSERTLFLTLGGLKNVINAAFGTHNDSKQNQTPCFLFLPEKGKIDGYKIEDYPLIKKATDGILPPPIPKIPRYFYLGATVGTNTKPTPYANINIGLDINMRHKIELGASLALTQSDDVFIYDKNGILQNGYNYRGWNIYGRYGCNVMPKESRLEIVPLIGVSWNKVSGEQVGKLSSNIGESASSIMYSVNCRIAYDLSNNHKRNVFFHGTVGWDFGGKVKNLDNDYIKKWCSNRLYAEVGFIVTSNLFKNN